MTALDFKQVRPEGMRTSIEQRLAGFLRHELLRSFKDTHPDVHFHMMAQDLAAEFTRIAATFNPDDYTLQLRRSRTTQDQLDQLADQQ